MLQPSNLANGTIQGAVETAIAAGFRHIDTAYGFQNEADIGKALKAKMKQGVIKRQDMFIVSKVGAMYYLHKIHFCSFEKTAWKHLSDRLYTHEHIFLGNVLFLTLNSCGVLITLLRTSLSV